jgi:RNA polymerase sigma-70 factor (ECF subfamily)
MTPTEPTSAAVLPRQTSHAMIEEQTKPRARTADELVELFSGDVWRYVASQITKREDAEDVVMEVFAAAFSDFSKLTRAADQRLWLLGVARRKLADCLRKQYRRAETPLSALDEPAEAMGLDETQLATRGALARLPDHQRQALILKYVNGLSTEEVGIVTRRSVAATNSLLQRARQGLREALGMRMTEASGEKK